MKQLTLRQWASVALISLVVSVVEIAVLQLATSVLAQSSPSSFTIGGFTIVVGATRSINSDDILTRQQADALYQPKGGATPAPTPTSTINIISATYGGNVGAPTGNATSSISTSCNGKSSCTYTVDFNVLTDPVPGKAKDFVVNWTCSGIPQSVITVPPEAGLGSKVNLVCN